VRRYANILLQYGLLKVFRLPRNIDPIGPYDLQFPVTPSKVLWLKQPTVLSNFHRAGTIF
jgi:hypothetical protein